MTATKHHAPESQKAEAPKSPPPSPLNICYDCEYWNTAGDDADDRGECRQGPPSLPTAGAPSSDGTNRGLWPITLDTDWCGAYSQSTTQKTHGKRKV
jgi:hypothetical protein